MKLNRKAPKTVFIAVFADMSSSVAGGRAAGGQGCRLRRKIIGQAGARKFPRPSPSERSLPTTGSPGFPRRARPASSRRSWVDASARSSFRACRGSAVRGEGEREGRAYAKLALGGEV